MFVSMPRMRLYTTISSYTRVLNSLFFGRMNYGNDVRILEEEVASLIGSKNAIAMPQARVGIYLSLLKLIVPGKKVVLSPYTISDVVNMVIASGAIPVFADISRKTCNIDPNKLAELIDNNTQAVIVTHYYGLACEMDKILEICRPRGILVIEDAAQAFGTKLGDKFAGTIGDVGIFSFGMIKNVTSFYGGMVVTDNDLLAKEIRQSLETFPTFKSTKLLARVVKALILDFATHPLIFRLLTQKIFRFGHLKNVAILKQQMKVDLNPVIRREIPKNYLEKLKPLQARVALQQLQFLDNNTKQRILAAKIYFEGLSEIDELILPPLKLDGSHGYTYFPIQYEKRDELVDYCMLNNCDITASHHKNCASMDCFVEYGRNCPNSEDVATSLIYLPTYPGYSEDAINHNIRVIRSFFEREF